MDAPALERTLTATDTPLLRVMNAMSARLPMWTWRPRPLLRARELMASRVLGMGELQLRGTMPCGHIGTLMPARMHLIEESRAVLAGVDLGRPMHAVENPRIGEVALPARGALAVGQGAWVILRSRASWPSGLPAAP